MLILNMIRLKNIEEKKCQNNEMQFLDSEKMQQCEFIKQKML